MFEKVWQDLECLTYTNGINRRYNWGHILGMSPLIAFNFPTAEDRPC